jgi:hypothetical protein
MLVSLPPLVSTSLGGAGDGEVAFGRRLGSGLRRRRAQRLGLPEASPFFANRLSSW